MRLLLGIVLPILLFFLTLAGCTPPVPEQKSGLALIAEQTGFTVLPMPAGERSLLREILPPERQNILHALVLLRGGDRIASVTFYHAPNTEQHMGIVREAAFRRFSEKMARLIDETVRREGIAPIAVLAFTDPAFAEASAGGPAFGSERVLFARIRDGLYEFHYPEEQEGWVQGLLVEIARGE